MNRPEFGEWFGDFVSKPQGFLLLCALIVFLPLLGNAWSRFKGERASGAAHDAAADAVRVQAEVVEWMADGHLDCIKLVNRMQKDILVWRETHAREAQDRHDRVSGQLLDAFKQIAILSREVSECRAIHGLTAHPQVTVQVDNRQ